MENILITAMGELVERTESKIDDKIYEAVFGKLEGEKSEWEWRNIFQDSNNHHNISSGLSQIYPFTLWKESG